MKLTNGFVNSTHGEVLKQPEVMQMQKEAERVTAMKRADVEQKRVEKERRKEQAYQKKFSKETEAELKRRKDRDSFFPSQDKRRATLQWPSLRAYRGRPRRLMEERLGPRSAGGLSRVDDLSAAIVRIDFSVKLYGSRQ